MKKYTGKKPRTSGWLEVAVVEADDESWLVFVRPDEDWSTVKVVANGRAVNKANYWLGWNGLRFSRATDLVALAQHRPLLMGEVERVLKNFSGVEGWDLL